MTNHSTNAGVDAETGFALQRNTALYLLLENYKTKFKDRKYFICLEHHDDFLYCFLNDEDKAELIETYQSKKKSPTSWELNADLIDIIEKILKTGIELIKDEFPKAQNYNHILYFSTNQTINLTIKDKSVVICTESIKENNSIVGFKFLHAKIQEKIQKGIIDTQLHNELENFNFIWIDLNRTVDKQLNQLVGQASKVFGKSINDHSAAIQALLELFREVEVNYNQGNEAKLLDVKKRVTSEQIEESFNIISSKSKCYDYWRNQANSIAEALQIKPFEKPIFELAFSTAFDLFKSYNEAEHRKILRFVESNMTNCTTFTEEGNVAELMDMFKKTENSHLGILELKAIFFAAYFETTFKK